MKSSDNQLSSGQMLELMSFLPTAVAIYTTGDIIINMVNKMMLDFWGRGKEITGMRLEDAVPELKEQQFIGLLKNVWATGETYEARNVAAQLLRDGKMETNYYDFIYRAVKNDAGETYCIFHTAEDVTEKVRSQMLVEEGRKHTAELEQQRLVNANLSSTNKALDAMNDRLQHAQDKLETANRDLEVVLQAKELSLARTEGRLHTIIMTAPIGMTVMRGRELIIDMANEPMFTIWKRRPEEVIGRGIVAVFPELEAQPFPAMLQSVFDNKQRIAFPEMEVDVVSDKETRHLYVDFSYDPLFDESGEVEAILATVIDRTDRVQARLRLEQSEEALQSTNEELTAANEELAVTNEELRTTIDALDQAQANLKELLANLASSDARFRHLVDEAPVAIGMLSGQDLVIESANDMILKLWGKSEEVIGLPISEALPELEGQPFLNLLQNVYESGVAYYGHETKALLEHEGQTKELYFDFIYKPISNDFGTTDTIMIVATDVTQQWRAKRMVAENEVRFRLLLNTMPQQVWTATPEGVLNYVNDVVSADFGKKPEEMLPSGWQDVIHPDDLELYQHRWSVALKTGREFMAEYRLRFKDGTYRWHLGRALPLVEDGEIVAWLGTNTNIEIQKENEEKKDEFLSIASHELKTPLTSIKAYNQLIQRTGESAGMSPFLNKSGEHIRRLEKLIDDLLDVTRINAGKMIYSMEPFEFGKLLRESVENSQHTAAAHEIVLEHSVDMVYTGDYFRLEQVLNNFISNAIKYSPEGKKVIVSSSLQLDNIVVSVQDFGIGIAEENLDRLFDRYYRVDNTAMRFQGLGLGLFISAEILKRHKGGFWIESTPGAGSTFYFRLPLHPDRKVKEPQESVSRYEDNYITIVYNQQKSCMEVDWHGFQDFDSVQRGGMHMLEMLKRHHCSYVINDNTKVLGSWSEAADWAAEVWFPLMEKAGLRYFAWIYSPSVFSRLSAQKSVDNAVIGNVEVRFFDSLPDAGSWMDEVRSRDGLAS